MEYLISAYEWLKGALSTELFAALAAGFSFLVAWRQHVWNKNNHLASVRPFICDFLDQDMTDLRFTFYIQNKGLGPAIFESFSMEWDGEPITRVELEDKLKEKIGFDYKIFVSELSGQSAMSANDKVDIISFSPGNLEHLRESEDRYAHALAKYCEVGDQLIYKCRVRIKYRSFLDDETLEYVTDPLEGLLDKARPRVS